MSQVIDLLSGVGAQIAKGVADHAATATAGGQHIAGRVYAAMAADLASGKLYTQEQLNALSGVIGNITSKSVSEMAAAGKGAVTGGINHVTGTPVSQLGAEAKGAIVNSALAQKTQAGYDWAKGKGGSALSDLDAFYHNADGSYNRTKVGLTAAAGLGIAGIAGYNMNN